MTKGRRQKPGFLHLVQGTHRADRHGDLQQTVAAFEAFGAIERPTYLKGRALAAWKQYIEPAAWLDGSKEPAAVAFCELWAEFRTNPTVFPSARHTQMRAYMAELGLTDERNRRPVDKGRDEFFDD